MNLQEQLLDLDVTVNRIARGIDAGALMSEGLDQDLDPRIDGFSAICEYLSDTGQTLREQLDLCLEAARR